MKNKSRSFPIVFEYKNRNTLRIVHKKEGRWRVVWRCGTHVDLLQELHRLQVVKRRLNEMPQKMGVCIDSSSFSSSRISVVVANLFSAIGGTKLAFFNSAFFDCADDKKDQAWNDAVWRRSLVVSYTALPHITNPTRDCHGTSGLAMT